MIGINRFLFQIALTLILAFSCVFTLAYAADDLVTIEAISKFKKRASIDRIERKDNGSQTYSFVIYYKNAPALKDVITDETKFARMVLKTLVSNGRNPREEFIMLHVFARTIVMGETGPKYISLGSIDYNPNTDGLEYDPPS
jgi:hypothetical protein